MARPRKRARAMGSQLSRGPTCCMPWRTRIWPTAAAAQAMVIALKVRTMRALLPQMSAKAIRRTPFAWSISITARFLSAASSASWR